MQSALFELERPAYVIPTMHEIASLPWNGLNVVSTFSGCGGASLGWKMSGYRVLYACEFIDEARLTYEANAPHTPVDGRDVRDVKGSEILDRIGLDVGELDVLEGSPPCSSFSMAGKREKLWGKEKSYSDKKQVTDDLFFEFTRLVGELRPKVAVAENVPGLAFGEALDVLRKIERAFHDVGYNFHASILNCADFGVPQARKRLIICATRADLPVRAHDCFPRPFATPHVTLGDALNLAGESPDAEVAAADMTPFKVGEVWQKLKPGQSGDVVMDGSYFNLIRPRRDLPCPTITAAGSNPGSASVTHPDYCRKMTPTELRAVCSFPRDFVLTGVLRSAEREGTASTSVASPNKQYERLGRAVPPFLYRAVSAHIAKEVLA